MTHTNNSKKALVLTVGTGKVDELEQTLIKPMLKSIELGEWDRIVLLPSRMTEQFAHDLQKRIPNPAVANDPLPKEGQENNADACFGHFDSVLARLIEDGFTPSGIVVDFTRGTKAMSAALVLAAIGQDIPVLRYVHSERRDERGMVVPGTEKIGEIQTTLATARRRLDLAADLMRRGDFGATIELLPDLDGPFAGLFPEKLHVKAAALRAAARIYAAWDRLNYKEADEAMKQLGPMAAEAGEAGEFAPIPEMRQWLARLARQPNQTNYEDMKLYLRALACDLLANAERRLRDGHFEDALLRSYRVLELIGQIRLFALDYDSAALPPDNKKIETLRKRLQRKRLSDFSKDGRTGKLRASRELAAQLLKTLGDPLAQRLLEFDSQQGNVHPKKRNLSVLIHGFTATAPPEKAPMRDVLRDLEKLLIEDDPKATKRLIVARSLSFYDN